MKVQCSQEPHFYRCQQACLPANKPACLPTSLPSWLQKKLLKLQLAELQEHVTFIKYNQDKEAELANGPLALGELDRLQTGLHLLEQHIMMMEGRCPSDPHSFQ
jgi:hypothetical protein